MPVLDNPPTAGVKRTSLDKYGCYNRDSFKDEFWAIDRRFFPDGRFELTNVSVPFRMSKECRYDHSLSDVRCDMCKHAGSGEKYDKEVRSRGQ